MLVLSPERLSTTAWQAITTRPTPKFGGANFTNAWLRKVMFAPICERVLIACTAADDSRQLAAIEDAAEDQLPRTFAAQGNRELNECMLAKGWLSMSDVILAP